MGYGDMAYAYGGGGYYAPYGQSNESWSAERQYNDALNRRNNYAAGMGIGFDGMGRMTLTGNAFNRYASPSELGQVQTQLNEHNAALMQRQQDLMQANYRQQQAEYARQMNQMEDQRQRWMAMNEREQSRRERATQMKYDAANNMNKTFRNMFAQSSGLLGGILGQTQMPSTTLFGAEGQRIGGTTLGGLMPTRKPMTGVYA